MSTSPPRRHLLDSEVRRSAQGRLLTGGTPGRMVRLSAAGSAALDRILAGSSAPGAEALHKRLRETGMLHPLASGAETRPVSFVIPVRDGGESLPCLIEEALPWGEVLVVDDGSSDGSPQRAREAGARLLTNRGAPGPAGARNTGAAAARTSHVAFLDADCRCPTAWAGPLAALLDEDPELAVAAPRVRSARGESAIARYEASGSPLDMGANPGLVGPGRRIGFLPAAALVVRREALLELGGFDEALRFGEDVDLIWRAVAAGWSVRYCPEVEVIHRPRASATALARQRFAYGSSAARLDRRHPGAVAPLHLNPHTAAVWLAAARLGAAGATIAMAISVVTAASRGSDHSARLALAALTLRAHLDADRKLARAVVRDWLPLTALAALLSPRARRLALLAFAIDATASAAAAGAAEAKPAHFALRGLDNLAYGAGLWRGAFEARSARALLPRFRLRSRRR